MTVKSSRDELVKGEGPVPPIYVVNKVAQDGLTWRPQMVAG